MATRIGVIAEGPIDYVLVSALIERIAKQKAAFTWPVTPDDVARLFPIRKRGHGGVLESVRRLVNALEKGWPDHKCFIILLDRRTQAVQREIRRLIASKGTFILAVAIEEIEAWWLGDRTNTLLWSGLRKNLPSDCRYAARDYHAEKDPSPKRTLDELTHLSDRFDRCYGEGNLDLAQEFAEEYWRRCACLEEIAGQCPRGYAPFQDHLALRLRRIKQEAGRLV